MQGSAMPEMIAHTLINQDSGYSTYEKGTSPGGFEETKYSSRR